MKKSIISLMILSLVFVANMQIAQAKGENGKIGVKQESTALKGNKHQNARINKGEANSSNIGTNKRLEGKEKAIQRRLEGKEKAIERRLEGKEKMMEQRSENAGQRIHHGHGKHKLNSNNSNTKRHTNRGLDTTSNNRTRQERNKRYIKQNSSEK